MFFAMVKTSKLHLYASGFNLELSLRTILWAIIVTSDFKKVLEISS